MSNCKNPETLTPISVTREMAMERERLRPPAPVKELARWLTYSLADGSTRRARIRRWIVPDGVEFGLPHNESDGVSGGESADTIDGEKPAG